MTKILSILKWMSKIWTYYLTMMWIRQMIHKRLMRHAQSKPRKRKPTRNLFRVQRKIQVKRLPRVRKTLRAQVQEQSQESFENYIKTDFFWSKALLATITRHAQFRVASVHRLLRCVIELLSMLVRRVGQFPYFPPSPSRCFHSCKVEPGWAQAFSTALT